VYVHSCTYFFDGCDDDDDNKLLADCHKYKSNLIYYQQDLQPHPISLYSLTTVGTTAPLLMLQLACICMMIFHTHNHLTTKVNHLTTKLTASGPAFVYF
jgi:hypothetical protein